MQSTRAARRNWWLLILAFAIPFVVYSAGPRSSQPELEIPPKVEGMSFPQSNLPLHKMPLGTASKYPPRITNVQVADFDRDGIADVLVCDARRNAVLWHRQFPLGTWEERILGEDMVAPAHATVVDLDQDGDSDVIVSVLGNIYPDDDCVGRVVWLEQTSTEFVRHILLDNVRRVADVQAGDLDGDGDLDLAVAVFGYARGQVLWLENHGENKFEEHRLRIGAGPIHVPIADFDGDGDLDICTVFSQNDEEIWGFENLGAGQFRERRLQFTFNFDIGSAGLVAADLDRDGDMDLLWPLGDNLEYGYTYPQPYHGCIWLENQGNWEFKANRIASFGGTYAVAVTDLDGDQDNDVVLVSLCNDWHSPGHASVVWLENDGHQGFTTWQIDDTPTHLVTVACGDLDGDRRDDIVAGELHVLRSDNRLGGVTIWNSGRGRHR